MLIQQSAAEAQIVHELEPSVEELFIYSRDDNIISAAGVEEYLEEVAARPSRMGRPRPRTLVFEKSR